MGSLANAIVLSTLIVLVSVSSGCISADLAKDLISPDEGKTVYRKVEKVVQKHFFDTVGTDPDSTQNQSINVTYIKDMTEWLRVHIDVQLDEIPVPFPIPIPIDFDRYVHVVVMMPNGVTWFDKTYNVTGSEALEILAPMEGEWVFQTDAVGYGTDFIPYHDSYKVFVDAYEPFKKK